MMPSKEYDEGIRLSAEQHKRTKNYSGKFLRPHRFRIKEMIGRLGIKSILDYGCGRGIQYAWRSTKKAPLGLTLEEFWGIEVAKYDPAYPPFAAEPSGTFDLIICTHVLGIIPIQDLGWVIDRIYGLANKAIYVVLNTGQTGKAGKAKWRTANIPKTWGADEWIDILGRRRKVGIETTFIARPHDPTKKSGIFVIDDAGLRGPL